MIRLVRYSVPLKRLKASVPRGTPLESCDRLKDTSCTVGFRPRMSLKTPLIQLVELLLARFWKYSLLLKPPTRLEMTFSAAIWFVWSLPTNSDSSVAIGDRRRYLRKSALTRLFQ